MRIIYDLDEMTETARGWLTGGSVGLVPVIGNLHQNIRKVATSMTKLFQLVRPDKVYLGQKKAQQVALIRKLVSDLNFDLTIHVLPIVRENDGVAVSNQVGLLSQSERQSVVVIYRALLAVSVRVGVIRLVDNILWKSSGFWLT